MKSKITLPDSKQEVELERAELMFWIRRGKCPKWYAALYIERGQGKLGDEQMTQAISAASANDLQELLQFDDLLVQNAIKHTSLSVDDLSETDYTAILDFAKSGKLPVDLESERESVDETLETFRAVS